MTGQDLINQVAELRNALKNNQQGVLGRIFDLHDSLHTFKTKRNCVNCALECLVRLNDLGKQFRNEEIPIQMAEKLKQIGSTTLVKYRIPKPFRVFGGNKTYADFNTTDEEVERLLKAEPQHLLRFTMADGSPVTLPLEKKKAEKKPAKQSEPTE